MAIAGYKDQAHERVDGGRQYESERPFATFIQNPKRNPRNDIWLQQ